jgi:hypothetical protein
MYDGRIVISFMALYTPFLTVLCISVLWLIAGMAMADQMWEYVKDVA